MPAPAILLLIRRRRSPLAVVPITGPTSGASNLYEALCAFLLGTPGLKGALTDVYLRKTPTKFTPPFGIFSPITEMPRINTSADYWADSQLQFAIVSTDDVEAESLGRIAFNALMPKKANSDGTFSTRTRLVFYDGYEIGAYPGRSFPMEQPGRWQNKQLWAFTFQYRFLIGRSMGV